MTTSINRPFSTSTQHLFHNHDSDSPSSHPLDTPSPGGPETATPVHLHGTGTTDGKRMRERRVMPSRLQRVSTLLAGSIIEEEIAGAAAKEEAQSGLSGNTIVILTTEEGVQTDPLPTIHYGESTITLQDRQVIETPDFRTRDETEVMGKTRSMRSEEDTSDAAFERRHRKADNAEKRLRRWEKENLKKDRQKIVDRIDRLKAADSRILAPILSAREDRQRVASNTSATEKNAGDPNSTNDTESVEYNNKLEHLREELIEEHRVLLQRYDALLTVPTEETPSEKVIGKRKKVHDYDSQHLTAEDDSFDKSSTKRSISVSGAFGRKSNTGASSDSHTGVNNTATKPSNLRASSSTSSLPDSASSTKKPNTKYIARDLKAKKVNMEDRIPKPFTEKDGKVRAEHTYANIHARTSGGRFAPKNALAAGTGGGPIGSTSKINSKMGRVKSGQQTRKPSTSRKASTVKKEAKKESDADTSITNSTNSTPSRSSRPRGRPPKSPVLVSESNAAPSTSDPNSPADANRTRRVKLIFRKGGSSNEGNAGSSATSTPQRRGANVKQETSIVDADGDEIMDSDGEADSILPAASTPARAALTIEEAQALLAKAMADGDDDDDEENQDEKDAADAAASLSN